LIYGIEQDTVGGPARLSYAQVAQHHKEKVERMLREKQNTEQEKDKERKKEGSTSRVAQLHGDVRGQFLKMCLLCVCTQITPNVYVVVAPTYLKREGLVVYLSFLRLPTICLNV
jgi:hypothetical protein